MRVKLLVALAVYVRAEVHCDVEQLEHTSFIQDHASRARASQAR